MKDALQRSGYPFTFIERNFRVPNRPDDPESNNRFNLGLMVRRKLERSIVCECRFALSSHSTIGLRD